MAADYYDGFSRLHVRVLIDHSWKAAYGLELIRINAEADKITELTGKFYEPYYPTEEEFKEARRAFRDRRRRSTLRIRNPLTLLSERHKK